MFELQIPNRSELIICLLLLWSNQSGATVSLSTGGRISVHYQLLRN